jgi:hypothetical protein
MVQMTEDEFLSQVNMAETDAISHSESYMPDNRRFLEYYLGCENGYEVEGQSQVVSTEVADVVGSDMPAHVRTFLSGRDVMEFKPNSDDKRDKQEANEKTKYVHHIIRSQKSYFRIIHGFLKNTEIQTVGVLHYPWKETKTTEVRKYENLDDDDLAAIIIDVEIEAEKQGFEQETIKGKENADGTTDLELKITRTKKGVVISDIPIEQMLFSRNSETKEDADLIGHRFMARRGDLKSQGFDKDKIDDIPVSIDSTDSGMRTIRFKNQGGQHDTSAIEDTANDLLPVSNLHMMIDYDGDGIPERRHVIKIGTEIFENEPFDHVPYAISSAILMPNNLLGRSRAEITMQSQLLSTEIMRSTMDNIYDVGTGRVAVNDNIDLDSLLTERNQGVVMSESTGDIRADITTLETPFIGQENLLILQYLDAKRTASTGEMLANQGLDADRIYNETATRFDGIRDAGAAKVELVQRNIVETGFRDLFEGIAWTVSHFQSDKDEIMVLGKPLSINPTRWWNEHAVQAKVGEGAGDNGQTIANLSGVYQIQNQLKAEQSSLVDDKDRFNTLERMLQAMGETDTDQFFNDPQIPEQSAQFLMEQNKQLMQALQQASQKNPLAEAALVEQQGKVAIAEGKLALDGAELAEKQRQFDIKTEADRVEGLLNLEKDYTQIEAETGKDIPGKGAL